jgi:choline dehydrogenase-like flavoprotein
MSRVDGVSVTNHAGKQHVVKARRYVLACCAIQNARLLLASNDRAAPGLGNGNDLVGRYFMEHLELKSAELWLRNPDKLKLYQYEFGKTVARAELAISAEKQKEHAMLNGTVSLMPLTLAREMKPMIEIWTEAEPRKSHHRLALEYSGDLFRINKAMYATGLVEQRAFELYTRMEQAPNPNSRVKLDTERDALGMPRATLNWEFSSLEKHTLQTIYRLIGRQVGLADVGRVRLMEHLRNENDEAWRSLTGGGWHHMGTTRMSDNPKRGVVNRDCRLHQLENLYVAGSSCFPTSGAVNPTLTIVALSLRLADHLKRQQT